MRTIHLYFRTPPLGYKLFPGDRYIISALRKLIKGRKVSGIEKVFINLCKGLDQLKIDYDINLPFRKIKPDEPVVVLGLGKYALQGYDQHNPVIAGIGLITHPAEWPALFKEYPVTIYLQHSEWAKKIYAAHYGEKYCGIWPAGIDTQRWAPAAAIMKKFDVLIYNKIMWNKEENSIHLRQPIIDKLNNMGISYREISYGQYNENEYYNLLQQCRAMIFLCEHESQGFACCEALSMNVPVFAWDQGYWLDPNRFEWNDPVVPATSIPFFDERCGMSFKDIRQFNDQFYTFWNNTINEKYNPRQYILENLTLKKSAERMLEIIRSVYK